MLHQMYGHGGNFFMQGGFGWIGIAYFIAHFLLWAAVIYIAAKLINKYLNRPNDSKKNQTVEKNDPALTILRERYAKGEIDDEEFKKKKTELEQ